MIKFYYFRLEMDYYLTLEIESVFI